MDDVIRIDWGSGFMNIDMKLFFPITAEKMTKLYKKCIRYDRNEEEIVQKILTRLNEQAGELEGAILEHSNRKNELAEQLALARGRENKKKWREKVTAESEQIRTCNNTLKQVQKNIELLTLLSTAKK